MAQPAAYTPVHSFVADSATLANFPGQQLDVEFNAISGVTEAIESNLALIQRDDGGLANGTVTFDALSASLQTAGLTPALPWQMSVTYSVGSNVIVGTTLYRCIVAHTSNVFATDLSTGKWLLIAVLQAGPQGTIGPAGPDNTLSIGTVTSGAAAATITGSAPNQTLNLVLQTGAGYGGTSSTSLLIANSTTKTFVTQGGLAYQVGDYVRAKSAANGVNYMEGLVSSYSGTTLAIAVTAIGGSGTFADWQINQSGSPGAAGGVTSFNGQTGSVVSYFPPQGRLTLTSGVAAPGTTVAAATTVYYTPAQGNMVPIYDGANMLPTAVAEVSQTTTDTTKSPAAVVNNSNYDVFVWNDSGTIRATRGPAWTNDTTRSAGTALTFVNGIALNNASITNGPAASRGTYVGTIRSNGSATIDWVFGTIAAGGGMASFGVWNAYNRVPIKTFVGDSNDNWTYAVANTWRAPNGNATMRVNAVRGLDVDPVSVKYKGLVAAGATTNASCGIGLDSTNTMLSGSSNGMTASTALISLSADYGGLMGLGFHFFSALERNSTTTASTWFGDGSDATSIQSGLHADLWQ